MAVAELIDRALNQPVITVPSAVLAGILLLAFARSVLVAIKEGREFNLGPLKIGSRTRADTTGETVLQPAPGPRHGIVPPPLLPRAELVFTAQEADQFYGRIAIQYDVRNTGPLLSTQILTKSWIRRSWGTKPVLEVLDLGGGTGREIATHFAEEDDITWTYVDFCPAMVAQFRANLVDIPVRMKVNVRTDDIMQVHKNLPLESYDIVLLSLVLTSMPTPPDFAAPLYTVRVNDETVSLRTCPVQPHQVTEWAARAGLRHVETNTVTRNTSCYAFVAIFTRPPDSPRELT